MFEEIKSKVFQYIGEASMCWNPIPQGLFDVPRALDVGNRLVAELEPLLAELRASRAVVEEAKGHIDTAFILQTVLKQYDEAAR